MSYILDALKRAESERDRGAIPGLLSQHGSSRRDPDQTRSAPPIWLMAAAAVLLLLLGAGLWRWLAPAALRSLPPEPPHVLASTTLPAQNAPPAASAMAPLVQPPAITSPTTVQTPQPLSRAAVVPVTTAAVPAKGLAPTPPGTPKSQATAPISSTVSPSTVVTASATPVAPPATKVVPPAQDHGNVPMLSDLPASVRSQIPAINIAGTVYSESPAQRLLLTETGVFSPGSTVVPGVLLEQILTDGAIFNFHGTRFQINH